MALILKANEKFSESAYTSEAAWTILKVSLVSV